MRTHKNIFNSPKYISQDNNQYGSMILTETYHSPDDNHTFLLFAIRNVNKETITDPLCESSFWSRMLKAKECCLFHPSKLWYS